MLYNIQLSMTQYKKEMGDSIEYETAISINEYKNSYVSNKLLKC